MEGMRVALILVITLPGGTCSARCIILRSCLLLWLWFWFLGFALTRLTENIPKKENHQSFEIMIFSQSLTQLNICKLVGWLVGTCQPVKFQYACLPTGSTSPERLDDDGAKNNEECWEDQGQNRHHLSPCRKKNEVKNWVWIETYRKKIQCTAQSFLSNNFVSTCLYTLEQQHYSCN